MFKTEKKANPKDAVAIVPTNDDASDASVPEITLGGVPESADPFASDGPGFRTVRGSQMSDEDISKHLDRAFGSALAAKADVQLRHRNLWKERFTKRFDMAVGLVILVNAAAIAIETDMPKDNVQGQQILFIAENVFCVIFTCEVIIRVWLGCKDYFRDPYNWADLALVVSSDIDVWILRTLNVEGSGIKVVSVMRMLRLFRLARLLRVFRMFKELWLIVAGLTAAVRTLFWASLFLFLVIFMFAVFATQMIGHPTNEDGSYVYDVFEEDTVFRLFGNVPRSMMSLFICITDGCVESIVRPMCEVAPGFVLYWLLYIFVTMLGLMNLIIGIFCENACTTAAANEETITERLDEQKMRVLNNVKVAFIEMDADGSGEIDRDEYYHAITHNKKVQQSMARLGLDQEDGLFDKIDADKSGAVSFDEFIEGVTLIMKGNEPAKGKDMVGTFLSVQALSKNVQRIRDSQGEMMEALEELRDAARSLQQRARSPEVTPVDKSRGTRASAFTSLTT